MNFDNYPAGLTLFAPHHVEVCPKQAVKPDLSVNLLDPSCQGDTVILEVLNGDSLNSSDYWVLYKNLSGGKSIDTSFHGVFKIVSQEFAEYFVRGESQCGFGPWNSVSFGDSIPPNISCSNLSIHLDSSPYEINFQQIIPDITLSLDTALEEILQNFNAASPFIASQIPGQYIFIMDEGEDNTYYIDDGGEDMFDDANILNTNIVQEIEYTGGSIVQDSAFGDSGRYFTQYMDGLFFMAADRMNISFFSSTGDLGSDGEGQIIAREFFFKLRWKELLRIRQI